MSNAELPCLLIINSERSAGNREFYASTVVLTQQTQARIADRRCAPDCYLMRFHYPPAEEKRTYIPDPDGRFGGSKHNTRGNTTLSLVSEGGLLGERSSDAEARSGDPYSSCLGINNNGMGAAVEGREPTISFWLVTA